MVREQFIVNQYFTAAIAPCYIYVAVDGLLTRGGTL